MSACTHVVRRMNTSFSPLYPYHARATPLPCSISAWRASERLRGVLICAVVVARRCFKWPVPTSLATSLPESDARCHSFLLCASWCGSSVSRQVFFSVCLCLADICSSLMVRVCAAATVLKPPRSVLSIMASTAVYCNVTVV